MHIRKPFINPPNRRVADRDEMARVIAQAWEAKLLEQKETCLALGINQGQFSRLVRGQFTYPKGHAAALFAYAKERISGKSNGSEDLVQLQERLTEQLLNAWDHTPEGARALGSILDGVQKLRRTPVDDVV